MNIDKAKAYDIDVVHTGTKHRLHNETKQVAQTLASVSTTSDGGKDELEKLKQLADALASIAEEMVSTIGKLHSK